jgi:hypothetical protein
MARQLRWWIAATVLACIGLAVLYLPPRGGSMGSELRRVERELPSPYRLREKDLAQRLRGIEAALRLVELRAQLDPVLAQRRAHGIPGPAMIIDGSDTLSDSIRHVLETELDAVWHRLGLDVTKISVGVVLDIRTGSQRASTSLYLLPDSSHRSSCIVLLPAAYWGRSLLAGRLPSPIARFQAWLQNGLGPCAFYAAFGSPGGEIGRWLSQRNFDLALYPRWGKVDRTQSEPSQTPSTSDQSQNRWFWMEAYRLPPSAIGCLAGRDSSCRAAVLGKAGAGDSVLHMVTTSRWWLGQALVGGDRYLADVREAVGARRFREFWNSELPVDTALAAVLRTPVGEWTRRWESGLAPVIRLGPAAPLTAVLLGLLLAAGAVGWVARTVARREVR